MPRAAATNATDRGFVDAAGYSLLFRLKTAKHTSSLGTERDGRPDYARGLVAGRLQAQGGLASAVRYLLRVMVQGTLLQAKRPSAFAARVAVMT